MSSIILLLCVVFDLAIVAFFVYCLINFIASLIELFLG